MLIVEIFTKKENVRGGKTKARVLAEYLEKKQPKKGLEKWNKKCQKDRLL